MTDTTPTEARAPVPQEQPARRDLLDLLKRLDAHEGSLATVILDVHAGDDPNAPAQRADAALRGLSLERERRERLERQVRERLRSAGEGVLVLFLDPARDEPVGERLLRVAPPLPGGTAQAAAWWGPPVTSPLRLLLASRSPLVAAFVDERRARLFVVDLGEAIEAGAYVRAIDTDAWRRYGEHSTGMPGRPARGGAGMDDFEARKDAWTARFVAELAERLQIAVGTDPNARLALIGEPRRTKQLEEALSVPARERILTRAPAPADPDLPTPRWAGPLTELVAEARQAEDRALLERLEQEGVSGPGPTLEALQEGRLHTLVAPVEDDLEIVRCLEPGWIAPDEASARAVCPDGPIERAWLRDRLYELLQSGRADLRLLHGDAGREASRRFGPVAGLPRRG